MKKEKQNRKKNKKQKMKKEELYNSLKLIKMALAAYNNHNVEKN